MLGKIFLCKDANTQNADILIVNPVVVQMIPFVPSTPSFKIVGCIAVEDAKKTEYSILVVLKDSNDKVVGSFDGQLVSSGSADEIVEWKTNIVFNLSLDDTQIYSEGLHVFELYVDELFVDSTSFLVMLDRERQQSMEVGYHEE